MPKVGSTKYLQLPACDSDIGKPSPLALLAATCQRIGAASPPPRRRTPTPVAHRSVESPVNVHVAVAKPRSPSPVPVKAESPAPVVPIAITKVVSPRLSPVVGATHPHGYQLPLTPPSTPPRVEVSPLSPRVPVTVKTPCSSPAECPCHLPAAQPVLHAPSLRYSPYTMVVPAARHYSPLGYHPCATAGHCGAPVPAVVPPMFYASPYLQSAVPVPAVTAPFEFGTYLHHGVDTASHLIGKMHHRALPSSRYIAADAHPLGFHYSKGLVPVKRHFEEEVIDVVSV